jgi:hypothetical protein
MAAGEITSERRKNGQCALIEPDRNEVGASLCGVNEGGTAA